MTWRGKTEVEKAIAYEAIRSRIPDVWTLLEIVERTNPPDCIPNEGSDLTLTTAEGWQVSYFYDVGELDYIDEIRSPDGLVIDFWEWPMGAPGAGFLRAWRGVGDLARLRTFREGKPIRTIDCTTLGAEGEIPVSEAERESISFDGTEIIGGYLDWDASVIRRIPSEAVVRGLPDWTATKVELGDRRFSTDRTPYLVDLLKRLGDEPIEKVVFRMPSQVGHTLSLIDEAARYALGNRGETDAN
ncbi:phage terminase large subunit family protein [Methylobacterium sp. 37f]|uniref:phage terminase large subunit family protein n=1 Tax=Methylobacterium sp. 37f TaxID=2817058 RepID=UPI001FFCDC47|nr:phage terminase large subunit family protein [Methylobacterium sp. 37f]MCK2054971.1 hypothetical protein [Methylobacterium sp. 37f]